ncbi:MAG: SIMPL domain-containing protein [Aeromicrobium sp.]
MTLDITVRGSAEERYPAERALISMAVAIEGTDKTEVFQDAVAVQEPLASQLQELHDRRAVMVWSCDQVRVFSHRPYSPDGTRQEVHHVARIEVRAEFGDFERMSGFLDYWSGRVGVEIAHVTWDVSAKNRRGYEAEVRKAAVDDAVQKAQVFANAVRKGKVVAQQFADPGMLGEALGASGAPRFAMAADATGSGAELNITPDDIVIRVEVDARFTAD